jgi:adenylate cyclase
MNLPLKSKKLIKLIVILAASLLSSAIIYWSVLGNIWTTLDFQILDFYYKLAVQYGYGPAISSQIVYVTITDRFYDYFNENILDRANLAKINDALTHYNPEAVAYDIIFARPSDSHADQLFKASLKNLGSVYLPIGFSHTEKAEPFIWKKGGAYERFRTDHLKQPIERGNPHPLYAIRALMQMDDFSEAAPNAGHITVFSDPDGVYRHVAMLLRVDSLYFPTLALAMFLDYVHVPFEEIIVDWGNEIVIPAKPGSSLDKDIIIPIDTRGMAFIPHAQVWNQSFKEIEAHRLLQYSMDEDLQGNLTEIIEGNFAIIADISTGFDLGQTPLEHNVPRVALHASLLNGLLTNTFYRAWSFWQVIGLMCLIVILLVLSALPRSSWILYVTGGTIFFGILGLTWFEFVNFALFPIATVEASSLCIFFGLIIGLEIAISKDQAFIRNAFSKYVPEKVVNELLVHPELLKLGGEERILSVLFSDVENFTGIAENMSPSALVSLLNEYLSEMTEIILSQGGIIDKYEGDAIMAEFGAPLALPNHADMAVRAGLIMQRRLYELRQTWTKRGLPALRCRVGINTGPMVIGNMGSHQVFDYTVLGDAVNLASRLESANKLYDTYLMISEFTYEHLSPDMFLTRMLDVIKVKGKSKAVKVFEIYGENSEIKHSQDVLYYQTYHEAFGAYLSRNFATAREQFVLALSLRPGDPASQTMLARIDILDLHDLPDNWDGSVVLQSK